MTPAGLRSHETARFVSDLASYMTLEEKLGQLDLFHSDADPALEQAIVSGRVGGIAGGRQAQRWQTLATERSRLGIPLLLTAAPAPPALAPWALAASWDEALGRELGARAARAAIALGCNTIPAPQIAAAAAPLARGIDLAACEPHLLAHLAGAFCHGAAEAGADPRSGALAIARMAPDEGRPDHAGALELAQSGAVAAIDCAELAPAAAERAGFGGILVAECARIHSLVESQFATTRARSLLEAAERALAGGLLGGDEIDRAIRGVLAAKHGLALFRSPHRLQPLASGRTEYDRAAARARGTMVLLRNEAGLLPLSPVSDRVLVVGSADGAARACADALGRAGIGHAAAPGLAVRRAGESWTEPAPGDHFAFALTRDAARRADFVLVMLEEQHFAGRGESGWRLPGPAIMALLRALAQTESRLVAMLATAEPVDLGDADQYFAAVLQCWTPCEGFEEALSDILSGRASPQGRMPVSAGRFAFGHGLGFGEVSFGSYVLGAGADHLAATVRVANSGSFAARETVQVYTRRADGALRLASFRHVMLPPGGETTVRFELGLDELGTRGESGRLELAPGRHEVLLGKDSRRVLSATVEITPALARAVVNRDRGFLRLAG